MISVRNLFPLFLLIYSALHPAWADDSGTSGLIVVANRASGTLSVINTSANTVDMTVSLPAADKAPEPMYVVHSPRAHRVFVGDRANHRVVYLNDRDFSVQGSVPAGRGIFHMWIDAGDNQLWVNNDIDKTASVIDPMSLETLQTVPMPQDLVDLGGKPHDVILDPTGEFAYVTMDGLQAASDYVVKFSTETFQELARANVGKDPHVALNRQDKLLYVPSQNSNAVYILYRKDLAQKSILFVSGAHGAGMPRNGKTFYTTNLPGGGNGGVVAIDTKSAAVLTQIDTPFPVPHNIALTPNGATLYVTHSGAAADKVSVYRTSERPPYIRLLGDITVGLNPFGLTYVPR